MCYFTLHRFSSNFFCDYKNFAFEEFPSNAAQENSYFAVGVCLMQIEHQPHDILFSLNHEKLEDITNNKTVDISADDVLLHTYLICQLRCSAPPVNYKMRGWYRGGGGGAQLCPST